MGAGAALHCWPNVQDGLRQVTLYTRPHLRTFLDPRGHRTTHTDRAKKLFSPSAEKDLNGDPNRAVVTCLARDATVCEALDWPVRARSHAHPRARLPVPVRALLLRAQCGGEAAGRRLPRSGSHCRRVWWQPRLSSVQCKGGAEYRIIRRGHEGKEQSLRC